MEDARSFLKDKGIVIDLSKRQNDNYIFVFTKLPPVTAIDLTDGISEPTEFEENVVILEADYPEPPEEELEGGYGPSIFESTEFEKNYIISDSKYPEPAEEEVEVGYGPSIFEMD